MFRTRRARRTARRGAAVLLLTLAAATAVAPAQAAGPVGYAATVLAGGTSGTPVTSPSNATVVDGALTWVSSPRRAVWRRAADGTTTVLAGIPGASGRPTPGPATASTFVQPNDVAVDGATTYVADGGGYLLAVRDGTLSIVAGTGNTAPVQGAPATGSGLGSPYGLAVDTDHTVWLASTGALTHVRADGKLDVFTSPTAQELRDVAVGPDGTVWVADYRAGDVKRLDRSTGALVRVPELSGSGALSGFPTSIAVTTTGDVLTTFAYGSGLVRWRAGRVDVLALTTGTGTADAASFDVSTVSTGSGGLVDVVGGGSTPRIAAIAEGSAARCVPGPVPVATEGSAYSHRFGTSGWPAPTVAVAAGSALPAGLSLSSDGVLSGTPVTAGSSTFDLAVSNRYASDSCTVTFQVQAVAPPPPPAPTTSATSPAPPRLPPQLPPRRPRHRHRDGHRHRDHHRHCDDPGRRVPDPRAAASADDTLAGPSASPSVAPSTDGPTPPTTLSPTTTPTTTPTATPTAVAPSATATTEPLPPAPSTTATPSTASAPRTTTPAPRRHARRCVAPRPRTSGGRAPVVPGPFDAHDPRRRHPPRRPTPWPGRRARRRHPRTRPPVRQRFRCPVNPAPGSSVRRNVGPAVVLDAVAAGVQQVAMALVAQRQVSVGVLIVVAAFLLVQDRLDRSDPKLAQLRWSRCRTCPTNHPRTTRTTDEQVNPHQTESLVSFSERMAWVLLVAFS